MSWLILADDLTGAADAADAFARRGAATTVGWGAGRPEGADVFAYDCDSRGLSAADAALRRRANLQALAAPDRRLFLKIDSTLRGQPAAEIQATLQATGAFGLLAPAFPAMGRTTEASRIRVRGVALEDTDTWRLEHTYPTADLLQVLGGAGLRVQSVPLSDVRSGDLPAVLAGIAAAGDVAVCDAVTDEDLDAIAAAGAALERPTAWIGSGGLSAALARTSEAAGSPALNCTPGTGGVLVVVGSLAQASRAAAARLVESGLVVHAPIDADRLSGVEAVAAALAGGHDVLVELVATEPPDLARGAQLARSLAERLAPAAAEAGALVVTGGETARALLGACGVGGLRLAGGPEPGITLGLTLGNRPIPLVTKAGAFGDDGVLIRAVERLRRIKHEGIVA